VIAHGTEEPVNEVRDALREFVGQLLRHRGDITAFGDDDPLVGSGRLDSIEVIQIVAFMEERFGVDFAAVEFDRGAFETISTMLALVRSIQSAA
jgi:acyl carrier protein